MQKFSPKEVLEIALKVESHGETLYRQLEECTKDPEARELWKYLKEAEIDHARMFGDMLKNINGYLIYEYSPGEYDLYLDALAGQYIITAEVIQKKVNCAFSSPLEAIEFGIFIEKESILTYSAFPQFVREDKQEIIRKIIQEEKKHFVKLTEIKQKLKAQ